MPRTAIRHTLSVLAALAFISASAGGAASVERFSDGGYKVTVTTIESSTARGATAGTSWAQQINKFKANIKERSSGNGRDDGWCIGVRASSE